MGGMEQKGRERSKTTFLNWIQIMTTTLKILFYASLAFVTFLFLYSLAGAVLEFVEKQYISAAYNGIMALEHAVCLAMAYTAYQLGSSK